jgi:predicted NBD/HSP70 family sugar kinase
MPTLPSSQTALRIHNEDRFLEALVDDAFAHASSWHEPSRGLTHMQISTAAGLSRPLVSELVSSRFQAVLRSQGNNHQTKQRGRRGGDPISVGLRPEAGVAVAIEIGHAIARVAVSDLHGQLFRDPQKEHDEQEGNFDKGPGDVLDWATDKARELVRAAGASADDIVGVGISVAGPVNSASGEIRSSMGGSWPLIRPAKEFQQRLGWDCPFFLDNDANMSAVAEFNFGAGRGHTDVVYLKWAEGVGCGVIIAGRLHRGVGGVAGEISHSEVGDATKGEECPRCHRKGCLETIASLKAILERTKGVADTATAAELIDAASNGSRAARHELGVAAEAIGMALGPHLNALNPGSVILGGALGARAYALVADELFEGMRAKTMEAALRDAIVVSGTLLGTTTVRGTIAMVLRRHVAEFLRRRT